MPLTNSQYDSILRQYEEIQNENRHNLQTRKQEVYRKIPEYAELERTISSVSVSYGKKMLTGEISDVAALKEELSQLSHSKQQLLLSNGFAADYLMPVYHCSDCHDTGYIDNQKCHCLKQKMISFLYEQSNIKDLLSIENFSVLSDRFYEGEDLERFHLAEKACHNFADHFNSEYKNLFFYGSVGAGKSFLSNCIAKELIEQGFLVLYFSASALIDTLSKNFSNAKSKEELYNICSDLYNCDLLLIDDLGTEYTNAYVVSQLFSCLNERHLRQKSTLISTNLSLEELRNHYSERIFSRIISNYDIYKISGPDIRMYQKTMMNRK